MVTTVPAVTYTGTDPDPVEWANNSVKPAIEELQAVRFPPYRTGEQLIPLGAGMNPGIVNLSADSVFGCVILIDQPCSLPSARIEVRTAAPASATLDVVLYAANTLALVATFGSAGIDSGGYKIVTPGSPIAITTPGYYIAAMRPRVAVVSPGIMRGFTTGGYGAAVPPWNDWDYGMAAGYQWTVPGNDAAPSSLTGYTRVASGTAPVITFAVTP